MKTISKIILPLIAASIAFSPMVSMANTKATYPIYQDAKRAQTQQEVYDLIIQYQTALNAGDIKTITSLFDKESYSQWNDKLTADTNQKRIEQYKDLFSKEKFNTDFAIDTIWVDGNTAFVRTHHHNGSVVTNIKEQKTVLDLNREVFILHKENGEWKIVLYTFNTNPLQGVS